MSCKKLPGSRIEFNVIVPAKEFGRFLDRAAEKLSREHKIAGFRPGKAPLEIIEKHVGKEKITALGADEAIKKTYVERVLEEKWPVIGSPEITITKIAPGNDLEYKVVSAVIPVPEIIDFSAEVKKLNAEYSKNKENVKVSDEEIKEEIKKLQKSRSYSKTVERAAQNGDRVEVDFEILIGNVPIEGGTGKNYPLVLGSKVFIPGFEENLMGMKKGEKKEFKITFPKEYHAKHLAGKAAQVKATANSVEEIILPEVNDELAKSLGKFENLSELEKNIKERILKEKELTNQEKNRKAILDAVLEKTNVELPEILVEEEIHKMFHELEHNLAPTGINLEEYFTRIGKSKEEVEKGWRKDAEKRVTLALVLKKIAESQKIEATKEEIESEANKMLSYYKNIPDAEKNINMERLYGYAKGVIENEKVLKYLESL